MNLTDQLVNTPQREKGGSLAIQRLDYQVAWGITHLFELHASGNDYAVGFEFHDDIIVIDSASNPSKVRFYQVKTKTSDKNWTLNSLTKSTLEDGVAQSSIAGKMLANQIKFSEQTDHLGFVSNRPCTFLHCLKHNRTARVLIF